MKKDTHATTVAQSLKSTLKAINDILIIEEDPITLERDDRSGLTPDVISALKSNRLVLPEISAGFADKFPFTGTVISRGVDCKIADITVGTHVMFPRLGGMRWQKDGKQFINISERDIHAILD